MNIKQLRYVQVLANENSFGRAADVLHISQPSLSQYVKKIEKEIGMDLFYRSGGYVQLTDAGRIYIEAGRKILDIEHQMQSDFLDIRECKRGTVIVGTSPYRSAGMMPTVISRFHSKYPEVRVVVEEMTSYELIDAAGHGQFDICLTMLPVDKRTFSFERITDEELVLAVPSSYEEFKGLKIEKRKYQAIDAKELDGCRFIMVQETQYMQMALENLCVDFDIHPKNVVVVKSLEAQIAMVKAGIGMALLPSGIERFCLPGEVKFYSIKQELPRREVVAIWKKDRKLSKVTKELLDIMKTID